MTFRQKQCIIYLLNNEKGDKNMVVERDINGVEFAYENKDVLVFEPDPNQLEPNEVDEPTE